MSEVPRRRKSLAWWVRWAHVYVSMIGFLALLGFAVTGLTLNHASYFEGTPGDPVEIMLGDQQATPEQRQALREDMGLDLPLPQHVLAGKPNQPSLFNSPDSDAVEE